MKCLSTFYIYACITIALLFYGQISTAQEQPAMTATKVGRGVLLGQHNNAATQRSMELLFSNSHDNVLAGNKDNNAATISAFTKLDTIFFPTLLCNTSVDRSLIIRVEDPINGGEVAGSVTLVRVEGLNADEFKLILPTLPAPAPMGFTLRFEPKSTGIKYATLYFESQASSGGGKIIKTVPIIAEKQLLDFQLVVTEYVFNNLPPATATSATIALIKNTGTVPLDWSFAGAKKDGIAIADVVPNPTPVGGTSSVKITFDGGLAGQSYFYDPAIVNRTCNISRPFNITARVLPSPPNITILSLDNKPITAVNAGKFLCEPLPKDTIVQVYNSGKLPLTITQATVSPAGEFTVLSPVISEASPLTIPFNGYATIKLRYNPSAAGNHSATLRVYSNANNTASGSTTLTLTAIKEIAALSVTSSLDFGIVDQGDSPAPRTIVLKNTGTVPRFFSIPFQTGNFRVESMSKNPVPPGEETMVSIRVISTDTPGIYNAAATFTDSCGASYTSNLLVTVQQPDANIGFISPVAFGTLTCSSDTVVFMPLTNTGKGTSKNLIISNAPTISGAGAEHFSLVSRSYPISIAPGKTEVIQIRFSPKSGVTGQLKAQLTIPVENAGNVLGGSLSVELAAEKQRVGFTLSRTKLQYNNLLPNTDYSDTIRIINTGTVPLVWNTATAIILNPPLNADVAPLTTAAGAASVVTVRFRTGINDLNSSATFRDQCGTEQVVSLSAALLRPRIAASAPPPFSNGQMLSSASSSLNVSFGRVICDNSTNATLTITNTGGQDLVISQNPVVDDATSGFRVLPFPQSPQLPIVIPRGASESFIVQFTPQTGKTGNIQTMVRFASNGANAPGGATIATLNVRRDVLSYKLSRNSLTFSDLPPNTPATQTLQVQNTGNLDIVWAATPFGFGIGADSVFIVESIIPGIVKPGESSTVTIRFLGAPGSKKDKRPYFAESALTAASNEVCTPGQDTRFSVSATVLDASAILRIDSSGAAVGQYVTIPVILQKGARYVRQSKATAITAVLRYHYTLLSPQDNTPVTAHKGRVQNDERLLAIGLPIPTNLPDTTQTDVVLANLKFRATLGSVQSTMLHLDSVDVLGGIMILDTIPGKFGIDVCTINGPRLISETRTVTLVQNAPNPVNDKTTIGFMLRENLPITIGLYSFIGAEVLRIVDKQEVRQGSYTMEIDVSTLPPGTYYYVLQTPFERVSRKMEIFK